MPAQTLAPHVAAHAALLDAVRALRWPARRRVAGVLPGSHLARLRGPGGEFSEYRAYRQGDDPRRLDWRLLARSDRAYVRLADDHALLPTVCVLDASASMDFPRAAGAGGDRRSKWEMAVALAVGLAAVAQRAGDPVGVEAAATTPVALAPRSRRGVIGEIAGALATVRPGGSPPLAPAVARAPATGRVVVVSDFLGADADLARRAALALGGSGADVHAVHVVAAEELDPPRGSVLAEDPEAPEVRRPLDDGASRAAYLERFSAWRADLARAWRDAGAAYALVRADEVPARAVRRVVQGEPADLDAPLPPGVVRGPA